MDRADAYPHLNGEHRRKFQRFTSLQWALDYVIRKRQTATKVHRDLLGKGYYTGDETTSPSPSNVTAWLADLDMSTPAPQPASSSMASAGRPQDHNARNVSKEDHSRSRAAQSSQHISSSSSTC